MSLPPRICISSSAWLIGLALAVPLSSQAQIVLRPDSPLSIPTFTCSNAAVPLTNGALSDPSQVLNTTAASISDRANQQRWAYAYDPVAPGSHTIPQATAGATEEIPTSFTLAGNSPPASLSGLPAVAWQHFSGREVFAYSSGTLVSPQLGTPQSLTSVGFYTANPNGAAATNQTRFLRYQFYLAPEADAATYQLNLTGVSADDAVVGYYINDAMNATGATLGGGATADQQWKTGLNSLTLAVFDTNPSATRLVVGGASSSACALQTLAVTVAVQAPTITTAQTQTFDGVATSTAPGGGTPSPLPVGTPLTLTITGPNGFIASQNTAVTGSAGEYSLTLPAGLEPGSYEVIATLSAQRLVESSTGRFVVEAVVVVPPPPASTPQAVPSLGLWGLIGMGSLLALVGGRRLRRQA